MFAFPAVSKLSGHPWIVQNFTAMGAAGLARLRRRHHPFDGARLASVPALGFLRRAGDRRLGDSLPVPARNHFEGWTLVAGPALQLAFATFVALANWPYRGPDLR